MNETIRRFGHPGTLVADYAHWVVLLRPAQPTLGSLILAAKSEATAFSDLDAAAFAELRRAIADIERVLAEAVDYARINYLMLMMVDPHVHFHVIPRYAASREFGGATCLDAAWPKPPDLGTALPLTPAQMSLLHATLHAAWKWPA